MLPPTVSPSMHGMLEHSDLGPTLTTPEPPTDHLLNKVRNLENINRVKVKTPPTPVQVGTRHRIQFVSAVISSRSLLLSSCCSGRPECRVELDTMIGSPAGTANG